MHGDATTLPPLQVDAAFMTGNVAQVFTTDEAGRRRWRASPARSAGRGLVFEAREPARRAWERWTPALTRRQTVVAGVGVVEEWGDVVAVDGELVMFGSTTWSTAR